MVNFRDVFGVFGGWLVKCLSSSFVCPDQFGMDFGQVERNEVVVKW